jgi:hypothetical protein
LQLGFVQKAISDLPKIDTVLDYGCGSSRLVDWVAKLNDAVAYRYDPAIAEFSSLPIERADLVLNTDVLEHIPINHVDEVLRAISSISRHVFFNISTVEAANRLPNGDNAHCTVRPAKWWKEKLSSHFNFVQGIKSYKRTTCSFVTWPLYAASGIAKL